MDYSLPVSSVHGILQARILEWVDMPFSRGSSQPRDRTQVYLSLFQINSFQFSHSVMSKSLRPQEQHARLPCPPSALELAQTHVHWVSDAIQPSHPLSSSSPAFSLSQYQGFSKESVLCIHHHSLQGDQKHWILYCLSQFNRMEMEEEFATRSGLLQLLLCSDINGWLLIIQCNSVFLIFKCDLWCSVRLLTWQCQWIYNLPCRHWLGHLIEPDKILWCVSPLTSVTGGCFLFSWSSLSSRAWPWLSTEF